MDWSNIKFSKLLMDQGDHVFKNVHSNVLGKIRKIKQKRKKKTKPVSEHMSTHTFGLGLARGHRLLGFALCHPTPAPVTCCELSALVVRALLLWPPALCSSPAELGLDGAGMVQ